MLLGVLVKQCLLETRVFVYMVLKGLVTRSHDLRDVRHREKCRKMLNLRENIRIFT